MQHLYSTKSVRYSILEDGERFFVIDLFSNKFTLFLPILSIMMKRKAYPVQKEDLSKDFIKKEKDKSKISTAMPIAIVFAVMFFYRMFSKSMDLEVSTEKMALVILLAIIINVVLLFLIMAFEKKTLYKVISLKENQAIFVKRQIERDDYKKVIRAGVILCLSLWFFFSIFIYVNLILPNLFRLVMLFFLHYMILFYCVTLAASKYNFVYILNYAEKSREGM